MQWMIGSRDLLQWTIKTNRVILQMIKKVQVKWSNQKGCANQNAMRSHLFLAIEHEPKDESVTYKDFHIFYNCIHDLQYISYLYLLVIILFL